VTLREVCVAVLLWAGVGVELLCALGLLAFRDVHDRLHYTAPIPLGAALIVAAVLVHESFSVIGLKALLLAGFLLFSSPVLLHTTGRSLRIARRGDWRIGDDERIEVEG
jgi:multicomponent Na+:H+ antiporter subunit G